MNIPEDNFKEIEYVHGIFLQDGVQIILRGQVEINQYFHLIPVLWQACLEQEAYSSIITRAIWAEVDKRVPDSVNLFLTGVVDVGLTVSRNAKAVHGLTYLLKRQTNRGTFYKGWLGRLPASDLDVAKFEKDTNLVSPQSYRIFCSVHNGFLHNGNGAIGYRPIHKLLRDRTNALGFCGDGGGNFQVFDLTKPLDNNDYLTADWDHETDELSRWMSFWEFVKEQFSAEFG
jgi:hypothetical protein